MKTNHRRNFVDPGSRPHWYTLEYRTMREWSNLTRRTSERKTLRQLRGGADPDSTVFVDKLNWH